VFFESLCNAGVICVFYYMCFTIRVLQCSEYCVIIFAYESLD